MLPGIKSHATCIRFNPHLYTKKTVPTPERPALLDLPYRMVFAVGTMEQVIIYSTDCIYPQVVIGNIHYQFINDFAWDYQSKKLLCASSDGYISVVTFANSESEDENILGERLPMAEVPEKLRGHYEAMETVDYRKFEEEARDAKKNQFRPMTFKSKNAQGAVVSGIVPIV